MHDKIITIRNFLQDSQSSFSELPHFGSEPIHVKQLANWQYILFVENKLLCNVIAFQLINMQLMMQRAINDAEYMQLIMVIATLLSTNQIAVSLSSI